MKTARNVYLAYSTWRIQLHRSRKPRLTVRFFRRSRNHSLIWNFVMQGYYEGTPRTLGECEDIAGWSRPTTRKLLKDARLRGFLDIRPSAEDQRKRLVFPTPLAVSEYESMVKGHMDFVASLKRPRTKSR
jgi:DNA-binding MarR family transcriptional regulator